MSFRFRSSRAARLPLPRANHGFALVVGLAVHLSLMVPFALAAEEDGGKNKPAPMPPVRPTHLQASPTPAPKTAAPAASSAPPQAAPNDTVSTIYLDHGPMLPPASRARMHQCGHEWETMKASGAASDQTWRAFAQACLIR